MTNNITTIKRFEDKIDGLYSIGPERIRIEVEFRDSDPYLFNPYIIIKDVLDSPIQKIKLSYDEAKKLKNILAKALKEKE
jgi:Lon protease-like protein